MSNDTIKITRVGENKDMLRISFLRDSIQLGYLYGRINPDKTAQIETLSVDGHERGRGIGSNLLARFRSVVKAEGAKEIKAVIGSLDIYKEERFYKKNGFEINDEYAVMRL